MLTARPDVLAAKWAIRCEKLPLSAQGLTVVDELTRECLAIDVAGGIRTARVVDVLARLVSVHGAPQHLRSDNGPEFVSKALVKWMTKEGAHTLHRPWEALAERTNESFQSVAKCTPAV